MTPAEQFFMQMIKDHKLSISPTGIVTNLITGNTIGSTGKRAFRTISMKDQIKDPPAVKTYNMQVHRLWWIVYKSEIPAMHDVVPKDGNFDNFNDNFELISRSAHSKLTNEVNRKLPPKHKLRPAAKLTGEIVAECRRRYREDVKLTVKQLASEFSVSICAMSDAINGQKWQWVTEPPVIIRNASGRKPSENKAPRNYANRKSRSKLAWFQPTSPMFEEEAAKYDGANKPFNFANFPKTLKATEDLVVGRFSVDIIANMLSKAGSKMPKDKIMAYARSRQKALNAV